MNTKLEITEEIAERIISSKVLIDQALVPYKGIEVTYVGYEDAEGNPFMWEESEEPYAIVSFKAVNEFQLTKAVEEFEAGEFEEAVNNGLSMRMNVDKAREIVAGATSGTLVCHEVEVEVDGVAELALLPKNFVPAVAIVAKKVSLKDMLASRAEKKANAEIKVAEAEKPVTQE